ncbi:MAG: hypothetical protein DYH05_01615 [Acidobacteria bacterium ACB1]|nr:hypothetical protein [Pyrinomonadaceae bacterium]MCE7961175.1 hypothetical protein [Acidobacteria bacterium ACB1]RIJ95740.1 MAG: hypothetical protein DCC44_01800 [Acidobacteriota bacterium]
MTAEEKIRFEELMRRCIELGRIAMGRGDSPFGAVLACDGEIIAEGIEAERTRATLLVTPKTIENSSTWCLVF